MVEYLLFTFDCTFDMCNHDTLYICLDWDQCMGNTYKL